MNPVQTDYKHQGPAEPAKAKIIKVNRNESQRPESTPSLELQVKIEDQDHDVWLSLDALEENGLSGPAAVEELRRIREALEELVLVMEEPGNGITFDGRSGLGIRTDYNSIHTGNHEWQRNPRNNRPERSMPWTRPTSRAAWNCARTCAWMQRSRNCQRLWSSRSRFGM